MFILKIAQMGAGTRPLRHGSRTSGSEPAGEESNGR
jgi:hypothetical protein